MMRRLAWCGMTWRTAASGTFALPSTSFAAWLIQRTGAFPVELAYVGYVLGGSVILLFLGNLVTGTNTNSLLVLLPGAVASLLAIPAWNLWLGLRLLQ